MARTFGVVMARAIFGTVAFLFACLAMGSAAHAASDYIILNEKACADGSAEACFVVGWAYDKGQGVPVDQARATQLFVRGCDGGYALSCGSAGLRYSKPTFPI